MTRVLIILGLVILAAGVLWHYLSRLGLGRLPIFATPLKTPP
jgi:DUF2905 family protein